MATVTKTYTENNWSTYQSTWTVTVTTADMVVSDDFVLSLPTVSAKYVYSSKKRGEVNITIAYNVGGLYRSTATYKRADGAMTSGTTYTISNTANSRPTVTLSDVFTENNKTTRTVNVSSTFGGSIYLWSSKTSDGEQGNSYSSVSASLGTMATVTLDVPPTATVSPVSFDTPYVYAGMTTASVTVADATAYYGGDVDSATLTIGNQTASISGDGTLSILLNAGGTFTPVVTVTDSRGQVQEYQLDPITVGIYSTPTVNFDAQRTTNTGVLDDEGTYATIVTTLTFDPIAEAVAPLVAVADEDGITQTATTTWYSTRASDGTLSGAVTWSTLASGSTVYGLISITGDFDTQKSYVISLTPQDSEGITGDTKTDTLQTAFYTVDFLAGGHGIAFGKPAVNVGFECGMDATFDETLTAQDMTAQEVQDFVDGVGGGAGAFADKVIEQGTSGIWTYRKWASGIAECWGITDEATLSYASWGGVYEARICDAISFPTNLYITVPTVVANAIPTSGSAIMSLEFTGAGLTASQIPPLYAIRPSTVSGSKACAHIHVIGRWK